MAFHSTRMRETNPVLAMPLAKASNDDLGNPGFGVRPRISDAHWLWILLKREEYSRLCEPVLTGSNQADLSMLASPRSLGEKFDPLNPPFLSREFVVAAICDLVNRQGPVYGADIDKVQFFVRVLNGSRDLADPATMASARQVVVSLRFKAVRAGAPPLSMTQGERANLASAILQYLGLDEVSGESLLGREAWARIMSAYSFPVAHRRGIFRRERKAAA